MSAPSIQRAGKRQEPMPEPWQMPSVQEAQVDLDEVMDKVMRGEKVEPAELAAAEAAVRLAAMRGEYEERARRQARRDADLAAAAEGEAWLASEAPALAGRVLEAMEAAVEANRLLVEVLGEYERGANLAAGRIGRVRRGANGWPHGRHLREQVLDEVRAAAVPGRTPSGTPVSEQFARAIRQSSGEAPEPPAAPKRKPPAPPDVRWAKEIVTRAEEGESFGPKDVRLAEEILAHASEAGGTPE